MVLCMKCGKLESYKIKQIVTEEIIYSDGGLPYATKYIGTKNGEPRCTKCGRIVKFFKDAENEVKEYYQLTDGKEG